MRKKTLRDYEREAQTKATTYGKKVYLSYKGNQYRITFKKPDNLQLTPNLSVRTCIEFIPENNG